MDVVAGVDGLGPGTGRLVAVVGVFDGIHLGHRYLLEKLVGEAHRRDARPAVITFDSHPDEIILGAAPPLLVDPAERLRLLGEAGVAVTVIQHFDAALRATPYDVFVRRVTARTSLAGLLMTPDTAFGYERRGTPAAVAELGAASKPPFAVVVVPQFTVDGRPVSSSDIRRRVAAGDLDGARRLLGRPYAVVGALDGDGTTIGFRLPVALPPPGDYPVTIDGRPATARVRPSGGIAIVGGGPATASDRRVLVFEVPG